MRPFRLVAATGLAVCLTVLPASATTENADANNHIDDGRRSCDEAW